MTSKNRRPSESPVFYQGVHAIPVNLAAPGSLEHGARVQQLIEAALNSGKAQDG